MTSRVGRVALKLRLADGDRQAIADARRVVERVVLQNAFDELERLVHLAYGDDAIVRVRCLAVRWRIDQEAMDDPALAVELGRDLAASIEAGLAMLSGAQRLRPPADADAVVFEDADHALAARLSDHAEGGDAWFHAPVGAEAGASGDLAVADPARLARAMRWVDRMERREEVERWLVASGASARVARRDGAGRDDPAVARTSGEAVAGPDEAQATIAPAGPGPDITGDRSDGRARSTHGDDTERVTAGRAPLVAAPHASAAIVRDADDPGRAIDAADALVATTTAVAGLWYIVRGVLELDLAEHLWAAGVIEGDFLAHVACALAGPDFARDCGWRWFGGAITHEPRLAPLADWAAAELAASRAATLRRLGRGREPPQRALLAELSCLADDVDPRTADAVTASAALLCTWFCTRLGVPPDVARVRSALRVDGWLELGPPLRVRMAMETIDIELRRAGLDFDPGYVAWLGRHVEIVFA